MVKLARPKLSITDRIRAKRRCVNTDNKESNEPIRHFPDDDIVLDPQDHSEDKGQYQGSCYRSACVQLDATWYNHATLKYYCAACADELNNDPFVKHDAQSLFGHLLCTEGHYDEQWDYRYNKPISEIVRFPKDYKISDAGSLTILRPSIKKAHFDDFMRSFSPPGGRYANYSLAHAFSSYFNLHKTNAASMIRSLYTKNDEEARTAIYELFEIHQ